MLELPVSLAGLTGAWLLTYLLHSSVLIGAVWLVTRSFRLQPGSQDFLWRLALCGGVVTSLAVSGSGPSPDRAAVQRRIAFMQDVPGPVEPDGRRGGLPVVGHFGPESRTLHAGGETPSPECRAMLRRRSTPDALWVEKVRDACATEAGIDWYAVLFAVWFAGAVAGCGGLYVRGRAVRSLSEHLHDAGDRARNLLTELTPGRARARVMECDAVAGPCVLPGGIIALPPRGEAELSDSELRAVLAHEFAHIARADVAWTGALRALSAFLWIQPLNRLALSHTLAAGELVCDDWALARTGETDGLAEAIARVVAWNVEGRGIPVPVSMAGRTQGGASGRIARILDGGGRPEPRWLRAVAAMAVMAPLILLPAVRPPTVVRTTVQVDRVEVTGVRAIGGLTDSVRATDVFIARLDSD